MITTPSSECQRGEKFQQPRTNDRGDHDPLNGSQMMSPRLLWMSKYNRQRIDDNPPDNSRQTTQQRRQQPHHPHSTDRQRRIQTQTQPTRQAHRKHISISSASTGPLLSSGTKSEQVQLDKLFLHGASNSLVNERAKATHSGTQGNSELREQREGRLNRFSLSLSFGRERKELIREREGKERMNERERGR